MIHSFADTTGNVEFSVDAVVVGSGAGGSVVARELREAGLSVVMIEEGGYFKTEDFRPEDTVWTAAHLYRGGGANIIFGNPNILLGEGRCVGGSTTVNGGVCWRTPEKILKRWQWEYGLSDLTPEMMEPFFERVEKMIHANLVRREARNRDSEILKVGAQALGYTVRANIRSGDVCVGANQCFGGCPTGAKQATLQNYIPSFLAADGDLLTQVRVTKILVRGRKSIGVEGHVIDPVSKKYLQRVKVFSKVVVVCGGAIQTPALLLKSGLKDERGRLGRNLLVHPNAKVLAVFNDEVKAWSGVNQGFQVTEFFDEGILLATNFIPPSLIALALPLTGGELFKILHEEFHHLVVGTAFIQDTGSGRVRMGAFDTPIATYDLTDFDFHQVIRGVALLSEIFFAAGARKVYLPFTGFTELRSVDDIPKIYAAAIQKQDLELMTVHIMGTACMGSDPKNSVVNPFGEFHGVRGLFVADASVFPTSIGVNPQVTIMALATRTAQHIAETFSDYV